MASPYARIGTAAQWQGCTLERAQLRGASVELAWTSGADEVDGVGVVAAGGLAFDRRCRLFRLQPEGQDLERALWETRRVTNAAPFPVHIRPEDMPAGDFVPEAEDVVFGALAGLAVDEGDRLFVAEAGVSELQLFDLWSRARIRVVSLDGSTVADVAAAGSDVWVALDGEGEMVRLSARGPAVRLALPAGVLPATRVAVACARRLALLSDAGTAGATVTLVERQTDAVGRPVDRLEAGASVAVPWAGDLVFQGDGRLVVARTPGADFRRFRLEGDDWVEDRPLRARSYTGGGIARDPDGGVAYWGDLGPRAATDAPVRHASSGTVRSHRFDSGEYQSQWGRIFLDVTLPKGARVRVRARATDDGGALPGFEEAQPFLPLHCRDTGRELSWRDLPTDSPVATLEAPTVAAPGRYLWVELLLEGNTRVSPRVHAVRVEERDHDYLQRLPRNFSRGPAEADFLRRFLGPMAGFLGDVDDASQERHRLLLPETAPAEMLPWLAGFLGLALDDRWPEASRRTLISEANELFRRRGTPGSLKRFLELYVQAPVRLVEHFRLRGLGGGFLRREGEASSTAVLGGGFRVGGSIGTPGRTTTEPLGAEPGGSADEYAHRFTVLVGRALDEEELRVVRRILEVHRPAHTVVSDVCAVGAGMRVGRGLHLSLSSFVGPTGGFTMSQVGDLVLGRDAVLGRPSPTSASDRAQDQESTPAGTGEAAPC